MLIEQLRKDKMEALKNKDSIKNGVVSLLIATTGLKTKELHRDLEVSEEIAIIQKELKQTNETLNSIPGERIEMIEETKRKISIIEAYLPKQMSIEEIKTYIRKKMEAQLLNGEEVLELNPRNYNKMILNELAGKADGKSVASAVVELSNENNA